MTTGPSFLRRRAVALVAAVMAATGLTATPPPPTDPPRSRCRWARSTTSPSPAATGARTIRPRRATTECGSATSPTAPGGRAYLRFDTSSLPPGEILSATLRVTASSAPGCDPDGENVLEVRRVTEAWDADFLYWDNTPGLHPGAAPRSPPSRARSTRIPSPGRSPTCVRTGVRGGEPRSGPPARRTRPPRDGYWVLASTRTRRFATPALTITMDAYSAPVLEKVGVSPVRPGKFGTLVTSPRPYLTGLVADAVGGTLTAEFDVEHDPDATGQGTGRIWTATALTPEPGNPPRARVPGGLLQDGWRIRWRGPRPQPRPRNGLRLVGVEVRRREHPPAGDHLPGDPAVPPGRRGDGDHQPHPAAARPGHPSVRRRGAGDLPDRARSGRPGTGHRPDLGRRSRPGRRPGRADGRRAGGGCSRTGGEFAGGSGRRPARWSTRNPNGRR